MSVNSFTTSQRQWVCIEKPL